MSTNKIMNLVKGNVSNLTDDTHPAANLDIEGKNHYLNVLALFSNVDGEVSEAEQVYLKKLIKEFGLPFKKLEELVQLAENPDEEVVSEFMEYFRNRNEKYHLLIDCFTLAGKKGEVHEAESELIGYFIQNFKISESERKFIEKLPEIIESKNTEKAFNLLFDHTNLYDKLKPILLPYGIDLVKYHEELKIILDFETEDWETNKNKLMADNFEPATKPVATKQFGVFLRYLALKFNLFTETSGDNENIMLVDRNENIYFDITASEFSFENDYLSWNDDDKPVTGFSFKIINQFTDFLNKITNFESEVITFNKLAYDDWHTFKIPQYPGNGSEINSYNFDEIVKIGQNYYLLNKGGRDYWHAAGNEWRLIGLTGSFACADSPKEFSPNLTFRLMKKVEAKKSENKTKK
ncbi:MAG: TerB family tellurite resistance protein [Candidatus Delongbacteria bacterium]|jgi:uncharacterized tellurite resistance protein B-like protein